MNDNIMVFIVWLISVLTLFPNAVLTNGASSYYRTSKTQHSPIFTQNRAHIWPAHHTSIMMDRSAQPTDAVFYGQQKQVPSLPVVPSFDPLFEKDSDHTGASSYYSEWHRMLSGRVGSHTCHLLPTNMSLCQNLGYQSMILPNHLQHEDVKETVEQSQVWVSLAHTECHLDLRKFLCALYAPVCVDSKQPQLVKPCQELCSQVRDSCLPKMLQFGFGWPDILRCEQFPMSESKMCVPLSTKERRRCSGCVSNPTFESVISSYCMADVVLRTKILRTIRVDNSNGSSNGEQSYYTLHLEQRPRAFKVTPAARTAGYLKFRVECGCALLEKEVDVDKGYLGRWIVMGKLSKDRSTIAVEYLSRIRRENSGLKRALRAIRYPREQLCQVNFPQFSQTSDKSKPKTNSRFTRTLQTAFDPMQLSNRSSYIHRGIQSSHRAIRSEPAGKIWFPRSRVILRSPTSFMLSRPRNIATRGIRQVRSERYRDLRPKWQDQRSAYLKRSKDNPPPDLKRILPGLFIPGQILPNLYRKYSELEDNVLVESEKDLFGPQNLLPWFK